MHRVRFCAHPQVRPWLLRAFGLAFVIGAGLASSVAIGSASTTTTTSTSSTAGTTTTTTTSTAKTTTVLPPANTTRPSISGTAMDGQLLSATNGSWTNSPTSYTYQWQRCDSGGGGCAAIARADSQHYTVASTDVGHRLRIQVTARNSGGSGMATSTPTAVVRASGNAPANVKPPSLSGVLEEGSTLTVNAGTWSGSTPLGFDYTWQRCDQNGNGCSTFIAHNPNATSYRLTAADVGHTLRVEVTATSAYGSSYVTSAHTGVVAPAKTVQHVTTIAVKDVSLPDRLVIDGVQFSPNPTLSRTTPIQARFHVSDSHGLSVQGALVFVLGLPYGWTYNAPEQATGPDGWVTLSIQPTPNMPLRRGDLVLFVRARKPGGSVLAGVSTRRLVQEGIR